MGELDEGNSQRAYEHITEAEAMAKKAVALSPRLRAPARWW